MLPKGFYCGGLHCGIAKNKDKNDFALFYSDSPCTVAGMFTGSLVKAAPVLIDIDRIKKYRLFQAIVANSGCANACTGKQGKRDALMVCKEVAKFLKISDTDILVASTGVIGDFLPVEKMIDAVPKLVENIKKRDELSAVTSIMTTDTYPKYISKKIKVSKGEIKIWACTKGSGMIHPNLQGLHATMLSLANGQSETGKLDAKDLEIFQEALNEVTLKLAKMMASDGEGATRMIEIFVKNTKKHEDAEKIASTIATSPLVKTALFGSDANWGRILAALGRAGVKVNPDKVDIYIGDVMTAKDGMAVKFDEKKAKKILEQKECKITIDVKSGGKQWARYYTCDFSYDYVKINGSYRS